MSFKLGLTGSIGMGKSTTAKLFAEAGCAVWDADAAVHRLYAKNGAAVSPMQVLFPEAISGGAVDRAALRMIIGKRADALKLIEGVVHPLVRKDRADFLAAATSDVVVFDIPLLFETGAETEMDAVACVTVSPEEQEKRVLERGTMTAEQFRAIRDKQMPNDEKCARSDYAIETDTLEHARAQVHDVLSQIRAKLSDA
ncbi:dephospho-CoA kinase [Marivita sp. XM-24bin2]|jgi:dephospho-CoA kinase|uniref:dephospho-CoA kinase n=1 Tax=unclassified Marivita TaxID=2632480 RepID=UPI000D7936CF|nr:dephospho-CoA kinase [Marivita sp. XM-24bin2]MCR9110799.1 dephospho-CoA kinase [Paracoccaceae bacterium]PWL34528.1 MAG: dephospho-CoA kinase [Marivita sp. XM-24bin2]